MPENEQRAALEAVANFRFSFDKRDQENGAYRDEVRALKKNAIAALAAKERGPSDPLREACDDAIRVLESCHNCGVCADQAKALRAAMKESSDA